MSLTDDLRKEASRLFKNDEIDVFIGFRKGTVPFKAMPECFYSAEELNELIFDETCSNNIAVYVKRLVNRGKRVGIAAVGCVSRSLVELLKQAQVKREDLKIIGIECGGVVDARTARDLEKEPENISPEEIAADACRRCQHRVPPEADIVLSGMNTVCEPAEDPYEVVHEHEKLSEEERWEVFEEEMSKCIRCYACRQACPVCFCEQCFVDDNDPELVGLTDDFTDSAIFQMTRFLHVAGRCVDCGACERACPVGVDLGKFRLKIEKDIKDMYDYESGMDMSEKSVLTDFDMEDTEDFMIDI